jgi:hypothetical protein
MLQRFMLDREYSFVDIRAEHQGEPGDLYFRSDDHFSPRGHRIVAAILEEKIRAMGFHGQGSLDVRSLRE